MNHSAVIFAITEFLLAVQLPIWLFYTREPMGAAAAAVCMLASWLIFRWSER